ncbi:MAG: dienelactone hydrolase family protein [Novosphingobium sp.]|uniref:dienelactone hydrolase family protein n=1 Tax=Novosphingobium sp. TaxID=1874826 RepID=UPI003C7DCBCE
MCDDLTAIDEDLTLTSKGFSRRDFAGLSAAGMLTACTTTDGADAPATTETSVAIATPDGTADALFIHPAKGRHPAVIMWPDIAGLREAYRQMATRLAASGYTVLVVNHYYRAAKAPLLESMAEWRSPAGQEKLKPAIATLSPANTVKDATAFVAWLDKQPAVDKRRKIGTQGYCQTGSFAVRTAAALPGRVGAVASFHGGGLVTAAPDSPHLLLAKTKAAFLIAIAKNDDARAPGDKDALRIAAAAAGKSAEIEVYNADHGWCTLDAPTYDKAEADRAWARLLALYNGL